MASGMEEVALNCKNLLPVLLIFQLTHNWNNYQLFMPFQILFHENSNPCLVFFCKQFCVDQ